MRSDTMAVFEIWSHTLVTVEAPTLRTLLVEVFP